MSDVELTVESIQQMPAGREMDVLVAERVMGWERTLGGWTNNATRQWSILQEQLPKFSGSIKSAWTVVECWRSRHPVVTINDFGPDIHRQYPGRQWWGTFEIQAMGDSGPRAGYWFIAMMKLEGGLKSDGDGFGWGETLPLAICRAALVTTLGVKP